MLAAVAHRGPDDEQTAFGRGFGVGFRRLAIMDPVHGQQPMATDDGQLTLVCNGEIYNHRELRGLLEAKGHRFRTASDSEVLLHGYREWGADAPRRLRGIFAFAVWDETARQLFVCRDRSGVKPLYLEEHDGELWFASEAKALLCRRGGARRIDLLACFAVAEPDALLLPSPFDGIAELGPGCSLTYAAAGALQPRRYWTYAPSSRDKDDEPEDAAIARYREELRQVVPMELMADVPLGACLSGGLDSSVLSSLAAEHLSELPVFTSVAPQSDDAWFACGLARAARLQPHFVAWTPRELLAELPIVAWAAEGTFDLGFTSRYQLATAAQQRGLKVLLSGQGVDELMGGYHRSYAALEATAQRAEATARLLDSGWGGLARRCATPPSRWLHTEPVRTTPSPTGCAWNMPASAHTCCVSRIGWACWQASRSACRCSTIGWSRSARPSRPAFAPGCSTANDCCARPPADSYPTVCACGTSWPSTADCRR